MLEIAENVSVKGNVRSVRCLAVQKTSLFFGWITTPHYGFLGLVTMEDDLI